MDGVSEGAGSIGDQRRLAELLTHVRATVPYYAELRATSPTPLSAFPQLSKREYTANLERLLSRDYADYSRSDDPAAAREPRTLIYEFTSGSSGYPMRTYKTARERAQLALSLLRKRKAMFPAFVSGDLFGFIHNHGYVSSSYADSLGNLSDTNITRVLAYLRNELRPKVLHGNPMLLTYYADYIQRSGLDLGAWSIEFIESVSEPLSSEQRRLIAEQFNTRVANCYGCLECYNLAYECPHGQLHVNEHVIIEIVDPADGRALAHGELGEVVITSLVNRAQPFVRYKTGDLARLSPSTCECGSRAEILTLTGRRKIDYLKLLYKTTAPDLLICGYDFFHTVMHELANEQLDCVSWFNVVQVELDRFEVQYLPKPDFDERFFARFAALSERELGGPARFDFVAKPVHEVLHINRKARVFRSLVQAD